MPTEAYIPAIPTDEYDPQWLLNELHRIRDNLGTINFFHVPRVMQLQIEGQGVADPLINLSFNIESVTRTGVGVYRVVAGSLGDLIDIGDATSYTSFIIAPSIVSEAFQVVVQFIGPGALDIIVQEQILGAGSKLEWQPYDLLAGDLVNLLVLSEYIDPPAAVRRAS